MNSDTRCPRCNHPAAEEPACRHLRWRPERGGPVEFARSIVADRAASGSPSASIPQGWLESQYDWLLHQITVRIDVVDGYCFADPGELDRLWLDIMHRFAPEPAREQIRTTP